MRALFLLISLSSATLVYTSLSLDHPNPAIQRNFTISHAVVPLSSLINSNLQSEPSLATIVSDSYWFPKSTLILTGHNPNVLPDSTPRPAMDALVWAADLAPTSSPAEPIHLVSPGQSIYALRLVPQGSTNVEPIVRLYPACWLSPSDMIRLHIDEMGNFLSFDWVPGLNECSYTDKIITSMHSQVEVSLPKLLPRPMKSLPNGHKPKSVTPKSKLRTGYKPAAKATGAVKTEGNGENDRAIPRNDDQEFDEGDEEMNGEELAVDKRSFLGKYWMYIVPVLLILMMGGGGEEPKRGTVIDTAGAVTGAGARGGSSGAARTGSSSGGNKSNVKK